MTGNESWRTPSNKLALTGTMIAFASLIVSAFALVVSWEANETTKKEAEHRGQLDLSVVSAHLTKPSKGAAQERDASTKTAEVSVPAIDITLSNRGSGPAIVNKVRVTVLRSENLGSCWAVGGPVRSSATYQFSVPVSKKTPFTMTKNTNFEVESAKVQRFTVTIGPSGQEAMLTPWIGVTAIELHDTDDGYINIGTFALVNHGEDPHIQPQGSSWKIDQPDNAGCMRLNARSVDAIMQTPGIMPSTEFAALNRALKRFR
ncbi:hypothetical protein [Nonomuraea sp. JJY05]|uniref:hypothetical protein n=1 Tax=Nonomuraea sp. JJY05 TaxID=3350255 RepID=UPI00373E031F